MNTISHVPLNGAKMVQAAMMQRIALLTLFLLFFNACVPISSQTPMLQQPPETFKEIGVALIRPSQNHHEPQNLYSVDVITHTLILSDTNVASMSNYYGDSVQLEFAIIHDTTAEVANQWRMFYTSQSPALGEVIVWQEYAVDAIKNDLMDRSVQGGLWSGYTISSSQPLVAPAESLPATLADWVELLLAQPNVTTNDIAKLLFSVQDNGNTKYVLYTSSMQEDGEPPSTDGDNICVSDVSGTIYCWIINLLGVN